MALKFLFFSGEVARPGPDSYLSSNKKLLTVITPWGESALSTQTLFEDLESQYGNLTDYEEKTFFVPKMMSLTSIENNMRAGVSQVNQNLFNKLNKEEYTGGFELLYGVIHEEMCSLIQIGYPLVLLDRDDEVGLYWMGGGGGLWTAFSTQKEEDPNQKMIAENVKEGSISQPTAAPLPNQLLGMYEDISFHPVCFKFQKGDRLILLSRHFVPKSWFQVPRKKRTLEHLHQLAAKEHSSPFWLSFVNVCRDGFS